MNPFPEIKPLIVDKLAKDTWDYYFHHWYKDLLFRIISTMGVPRHVYEGRDVNLGQKEQRSSAN